MHNRVARLHQVRLVRQQDVRGKIRREGAVTKVTVRWGRIPVLVVTGDHNLICTPV